MKQERHTQKEEREGRGEWRAGRREGGRGNSVEKGLAVRREKEEAVKLEKDVSAGPDYRGPMELSDLLSSSPSKPAWESPQDGWWRPVYSPGPGLRLKDTILGPLFTWQAREP